MTKYAPDLPEGQESHILDAAKAAVYGDRQRYYGHPLDNHQRTADYWTVRMRHKLLMLGVPEEFVARFEVTAEEVCYMNIEQKLSRAYVNPDGDTNVDIAGYAENVPRIRRERERRNIQWVEQEQAAYRGPVFIDEADEPEHWDGTNLHFVDS
jgi:hypothetical protein